MVAPNKDTDGNDVSDIGKVANTEDRKLQTELSNNETLKRLRYDEDKMIVS